MRLELSSPLSPREPSGALLSTQLATNAHQKRRDRPAALAWAVLLMAPLALACSGQRDDSLTRRADNSEVDGGSVTPPSTTPPAMTPPARAPVQNVVVGVNGGHAQSARFRAQVLVSFPNQPTPSESALHSATLLPRPSP